MEEPWTAGGGGGGATFHVDLDRLTALQSRLAALHIQLTSGTTHPSTLGHNLDPRTTLSSRLYRANDDVLATSAYGLLDESDPLRAVHTHVSDSVVAMVTTLTEMVTGLIDAAKRRGATYEEVEASVVGLVTKAAEGVS